MVLCTWCFGFGWFWVDVLGSQGLIACNPVLGFAAFRDCVYFPVAGFGLGLIDLSRMF